MFFSFPHIAVSCEGVVGDMMRPGRNKQSCACGALLKALGEFKAEGYECNCKVPGVHDPLDTEYSILKQRLARRLRYERTDTANLDLVKLTNVAERTITNVSAPGPGAPALALPLLCLHSLPCPLALILLAARGPPLY